MKSTGVWRSRSGWAFAAAYLGAAGVLFHEALTCIGWACDLAALPVVFPLGFPVAWLTDTMHGFVPIPGHTVSAHLRNWYFILPTVLANACVYQVLGWQLGRLARRLLRRSGARSAEKGL